MATFDDMDLERKVTVYDKGFDEDSGSYGEYITRSGDIWSPRVPNREPLRIECEHFVECVREGRAPLSDGASGLRVVRVLEGLQARLDASPAGAGCSHLTGRRGWCSARACSSPTTSSSAPTSSSTPARWSARAA